MAWADQLDSLVCLMAQSTPLIPLDMAPKYVRL
jgi:hypothetical protein